MATGLAGKFFAMLIDFSKIDSAIKSKTGSGEWTQQNVLELYDRISILTSKYSSNDAKLTAAKLINDLTGNDPVDLSFQT